MAKILSILYTLKKIIQDKINTLLAKENVN